MPIAFLSRLPAEAVAQWLAALRKAMPSEQVLTGEAGTAADIAVAANPAPGALASIPSLIFVQSAWAGVDGLLADRTFPSHVPLARLVDPALGEAMAEAALTHVLMLHRQAPLYRAQQAAALWRPHPQPTARERRVGVLGLGEMGRRAAQRLADAGFATAGWSRSGGVLGGVEVFSGPAGLDAVLARSDIVVNLLPLTPKTRGLLNRRAFQTMPHGACVVNLARGAHLRIPDLLEALDGGRISHAVLDVFDKEPLAPDSPLWRHPRVTVTPHVAAVTDPRSAAPRIAENISRFRAGRPVLGAVSFERGY